MIGHHYLHFGVMHKFAQDFGFGRIRAGQSLLPIDAVDADEHDIGKEHLCRSGLTQNPKTKLLGS